MLLPQNHKPMPLLLLLVRKIRSLLPEKIKSEMKLKNQETQEDGDSYGQSTLLLRNLQKILIRLKLLLLKLLPLQLKLKDQLRLVMLKILLNLTPNLLIKLLKKN
jgi:hypothetical protein